MARMTVGWDNRSIQLWKRCFLHEYAQYTSVFQGYTSMYHLIFFFYVLHIYVDRPHAHVYDGKGKMVFSCVRKIRLSLEDMHTCV